MTSCLVINGDGNAISTLNSRASSDLAANAVWQGVGEDVSRFGRVGISVTSSTQSSGVLTIEVSHDGITWGGPSRTWSDTRYSEPHMWNIVEKYFRIKYTNGVKAVSDLSIQVQYSVNANILLAHQLDGSIIDESESLLTRSLLLGKNDKGDYENVAISRTGALQVEAEDNAEVLADILIELRIINAYNALGHDEILTEEDIT